MKKEMSEDVKELVICRLQTTPAEMRLHLSNKIFNREQLIHHIQKEDPLGQKIVAIQLLYLRSMKDMYGA